MSWFKPKKKAVIEHLEPSIRLIEPDACDMVDVTPPAEDAQPVDEPGVNSMHGPEAGQADASASQLHVCTAKSHDVVDVEAHAIVDVPAAATTAEKKANRITALAARFKRTPAAAAAPVQKVQAAAAATAEEPADDDASPAPAPAANAEVAPADEVSSNSVEAAADAETEVPAKAKGFKVFARRVSSNRAEKPKFSAVPVRVVIGFLPEVTERDALEYAVGIAEKHFEQIGMSYFDAFEYGNGFAFEAHEGGTGKAYLPEVIRYFDSKGTFRPGEDVKAVIRTATRAVEVQRTRDGLVAIILPERDETPPSDWLEPTTSMQPAINKRTGFLVAGATLFTTGFIAMMVTSVLTRYQAYDPAPEPMLHRIEASQLPNQQWSMIASVPANNFVRALRYRNGRWESPEIVSAAAPASTAPTSTTAPVAAAPTPRSTAPTQTPTTAPVPPTPAVPPAATPAPIAKKGGTQ